MQSEVFNTLRSPIRPSAVSKRPEACPMVAEIRFRAILPVAQCACAALFGGFGLWMRDFVLGQPFFDGTLWATTAYFHVWPYPYNLWQSPTSGARRGPAGRFADRRVLARSPGVGCPVSDTALHCVALVLDRPLVRPALELGRWAALDPKISLDCALALHTALRRRSERGDRVYVGLLVIGSVDLDCGRLRVRGLRLAFETSQAS